MIVFTFPQFSTLSKQRCSFAVKCEIFVNRALPSPYKLTRFSSVALHFVQAAAVVHIAVQYYGLRTCLSKKKAHVQCTCNILKKKLKFTFLYFALRCRKWKESGYIHFPHIIPSSNIHNDIHRYYLLQLRISQPWIFPRRSLLSVIYEVARWTKRKDKSAT